MSNINQTALRDLLQSYKRAITKPNVATYELEIPNASWVKILVGLAAVSVAALLQSVVLWESVLTAFNQGITLLGQLDLDATWLVASRDLYTIGGPWRSLVVPFIAFPMGALFLLWMSRLFGGRGKEQDSKHGFLVHSYLLSLSYTPLRILGSALSIIPMLGPAFDFFVYMYQLYCAGVSMQASQGLTPNRALLAVFLPQIALYVASIVFGFLLGIYMLIGMLTKVFSQL